MKHRPFLHIGAGCDDDGLVVAAKDRAKPDADIFAEGDIADHMRVGRNEITPLLRKLGALAFEFVDGHGVSPVLA